MLIFSGKVFHFGLDLCVHNVGHIVLALLIEGSNDQPVVFVLNADLKLLADYALNDLSDLVFTEVAELVS